MKWFVFSLTRELTFQIEYFVTGFDGRESVFKTLTVELAFGPL